MIDYRRDESGDVEESEVYVQQTLTSALSCCEDLRQRE